MPPSFFFFNDTATTEIYTLSLHDALPISSHNMNCNEVLANRANELLGGKRGAYATVHPNDQDRKSTRLNSSHGYISYAVFCLKKKKPRPRRSPARRRYAHRTCPRRSHSER